MSVRTRIVAAAAALAALALSASTASACYGYGGCGGCGGCGYQTYAPVTVYRPVTVYAPVQPTYWVDQGPVYSVPPPTVVGPVPEYIYPSRGYGCGGCGYRGGWYRRHVW
jgi:hypothetical protein